MFWDYALGLIISHIGNQLLGSGSEQEYNYTFFYDFSIILHLSLFLLDHAEHTCQTQQKFPSLQCLKKPPKDEFFQTQLSLRD